MSARGSALTAYDHNFPTFSYLQTPVLELVQLQQQTPDDTMSARERNRARRKAKLLQRRVSKDPCLEGKNGCVQTS